MTEEQSKALMLANYLDNEDYMMSVKHITEAAAELRRLHKDKFDFVGDEIIVKEKMLEHFGVEE